MFNRFHFPIRRRAGVMGEDFTGPLRGLRAPAAGGGSFRFLVVASGRGFKLYLYVHV